MQNNYELGTDAELTFVAWKIYQVQVVGFMTNLVLIPCQLLLTIAVNWYGFNLT